MSVSTTTLYGIIAVLIALVIITSSVGGLYYVKYSSESSDNSVYVKQLDQLGVKDTPYILMSFGNGTSIWYNDTSLVAGSNMYTATVLIMNGNVNATYNKEYQEHFVTGVGGIENTNNGYWWLWTYNKTASWQPAQVGVDDLIITNDAIYAWTFCGMTSSFGPNCTP